MEIPFHLIQNGVVINKFNMPRLILIILFMFLFSIYVTLIAFIQIQTSPKYVRSWFHYYNIEWKSNYFIPAV